MEVIIIMQSGAEVLSVDVVDLQERAETIAEAAAAIASELWLNLGKKATSYAVLGLDDEVWLLQKSTRIKVAEKEGEKCEN